MKKILITDDEQGMLNAIRRDLSGQSGKYELFFTSDGNEVAQIIKQESIDILITDILMPEKEGIELICEVKKQFPSVKIISMSGGTWIGGLDYLTLTKDLGASYSLSKPFTKEELIDAIEHVANIKP